MVACPDRLHVLSLLCRSLALEANFSSQFILVLHLPISEKRKEKTKTKQTPPLKNNSKKLQPTKQETNPSQQHFFFK